MFISQLPLFCSPKSYHRRTVSCLAVASHHEHYEHPSYLAPTGRFYETVEFSEATSASPVNHTRHVQRKSEGNISLIQLQQGLSGAGVTNVISSDAKDKSESKFCQLLVCVCVCGDSCSPKLRMWGGGVSLCTREDHSLCGDCICKYVLHTFTPTLGSRLPRSFLPILFSHTCIPLLCRHPITCLAFDKHVFADVSQSL